ncbi:serine phosphatase RsbU (regulator of sigma subunit)/PAS domain-containing protein [Kitasatospora sp. MAP12-15]|uniref:SpoIIE family protein phosphatase n=1 Tax=unclassified Kitasatospora TaxID=2633591 RepID=UPI0024741950|nr:SpoIIE family protein phosphatase [Kitasatospora sp. MAP12-44]MDH6115234.1 serine phosphatase RsbU (regulator of sigma subunit)/PAS domain-containing protein [Kitasatospora sp. MAP12-44]
MQISQQPGATAPVAATDAGDADTTDAGAAAGIGRLASTVERLRREVHEAQAAADGRALIELAKGILVERLQYGPAQAARQLEGLAEAAGRSVLELAAEITDQAARDGLTEAARPPAVTDVAGPSVASAASVALRLRTAESGALAAGDAQAVARSLLDHALAPLGAVAVAIWAVGGDGSLTLVGDAGFAPQEAARWHYVPPGVGTPAGRAVAQRETLWFATLSEAGSASIGHQHAAGGRVAAPALRNGHLVGVLEICWPHALEPQASRIRRQIDALAELCAHTLDTRALDARTSADPLLTELLNLTNGLNDPALLLRPHRDHQGRLADFRIEHLNDRFVDFAGRPRSSVAGAFLLEAYPLAAQSGGLFDQVQHVHATGEPFRAERMSLTVTVDQVPLTAVADVSLSRHGDRVLLIWRVQDQAARLANLLQHAQRLGRIGGFEENLSTGELTWNSTLFELYGLPVTATPIPLTQLAAHAHPDDGAAIGRFLRTLLHHRRPSSTAFRLQRPDGNARHIRVVAEPVPHAGPQEADPQDGGSQDGGSQDGGPITVRGAYQDVSAQHWTEVALAATRDQLAHSEQQSAEHNRLARQLQHAIMPPSRGPIDIGGLDIAVRYRPAEKDHLVGGDWYDAVVLPSGQVLLCVGDIAGHGIEAATGMVALRNALRGLAATGAGPAQLLGWLNTVTHDLTDNVTATAICALYDPDSRTLRWARAGHLPPVLLRGDQADTLPMAGGLLLGAIADAEYEELQTRLETGDTLLLYTDGLIERKDRSLAQSLGHLLATAKAAGRPDGGIPLDRRLDHLLTHSSADTDDDTCIIGIQVR